MSSIADDYGPMFDWDELKVFLAVARGGSTSAAARALGVNQTTVARRIESLERSLGLKLVERSQSGAELTEAGRALLKDAEAMQSSADRILERARALRRETAGAIRVTCSEMIANLVLAPLLVEFRQTYPDVAVEMIVTDDWLDLEAGKADVAIRGAAAGSLPDSNLVARKVSETEWALYCSVDYAARRGLPRTYADLNDHALIGGEGGAVDLPGMRQMIRAAPNAEVALRSNSLTNLYQVIRAGFGIGPLPCIRADADAELVQALPPSPEIRATPTWLVTRAELKDTPRIRAFIDFMVPRMMGVNREYEARAEALRVARRNQASG
jgi:molybdate transport repressor ModE-like protein